MQIHQLAITLTIDEIRNGLQAWLEKAKEAPQAKGQLDGISKPDIKVEGRALVFSVKKKFGILPVTLSAMVTPKALPDGQGLELTLDKINAGFIGGASAAAPIMQQIATAVAGRPGLSVTGNTLTVTKEALAAVPSLQITGAIKAIDVFSDQIALTIG